MSRDWSAEIDKVAFDAGTFTDGFLDMASYSPRNAKITRAVTVEDVLALLKRVEAEVREEAAKKCDAIAKEQAEWGGFGCLSQIVATARECAEKIRALKKGTADE